MYTKKLKFIRDEKEINQSIVADVIGITRGRYADYEVEYEIMPIKHINTLCNYFDISIDYLFEFTTIPKYKNSNSNVNSKLSGTRLKELRKEKKLTQDKLSDLLKVSRSTITYYELGKNIIATPFLYDICKKYKISADYLLGKIDNPKYLK